MSTCYLCGSDTHTYDCPKFVVVALYQETFTFRSTFDSGIWRIDKILYEEKIPLWATHGWILNNTDIPNEIAISRKSATLKELADSWSTAQKNKMPWKLDERGSNKCVPGEIYTYSTIPLTVFALHH